VGFFDSFSSGVSSFFGGVGDIFTSFAGSPIGSNFLSTSLEFGLGELADVIGITPSTLNSQRGAPAGPLGSAIPGGVTNLQLAQFCNANPGVLVPGTTTRCGGAPAPQRGSLTLPRFDQFTQPAPFPTQVPGVGGLRPQFAAPVPFVPSSQPFGAMPGTIPVSFGGQPMPAFPVSTQQGFPPTGFSGIFNQAQPLFQTAGLTGAIAPLVRQLPGIVGGFLGAGAFDALTGGGGGSVTPMFRPTMAGVRAQSFRATNPVTGQDVFFRPAGKPILWSSDLSACKRVQKVAKRARRKR